MQLSLFILSLLPITFAAPSLTTRTDGQMALENTTRTCNDIAKTCRYNFIVNEFTGESPKPVCIFTVTATGSQPNARLTSFTQVKCDGSQRFSINGGWSGDNSFITIVPSDVTYNTWAFFGFTATELADGHVVAPDHKSPSRHIGVFP